MNNAERTNRPCVCSRQRSMHPLCRRKYRCIVAWLCLRMDTTKMLLQIRRPTSAQAHCGRACILPYSSLFQRIHTPLTSLLAESLQPSLTKTSFTINDRNTCTCVVILVENYFCANFWMNIYLFIIAEMFVIVALNEGIFEYSDYSFPPVKHLLSSPETILSSSKQDSFDFSKKLLLQ